MSPETLVIGAFGLLGAILSIAGLRLSGQLRRSRAQLLAEIDAREQQSQKLAEVDALRARAAEAREMAEGLRREVSNAKAEATALENYISKVIYAPIPGEAERKLYHCRVNAMAQNEPNSAPATQPKAPVTKLATAVTATTNPDLGL